MSCVYNVVGSIECFYGVLYESGTVLVFSMYCTLVLSNYSVTNLNTIATFFEL